MLRLGVLLACLAGRRISAGLAVLVCAAVTVALAVVVWDAPVAETLMAGVRRAHRAADRLRLTTTRVRREGNIIRYNLAWTFALLSYVLLVAVPLALFVPHVMGR